ncbi:RNA polymerase sigma-70 factor, ECF subfamily [Aquimarina amphilecti]|uniref:RNA polymerase sigma factor n=1 Tax=Aquimarina amphilecti TaxID=1038014 RepID=A0A1H7Q144_AQUAM|nr:sigma-70 family RNA polymerase sigma factor [Aquimarina amphilecti]SEL41693.1 RNA polymerase sigma-70 factor, ECF subfamily [Aquimarina amphilecti]
MQPKELINQLQQKNERAFQRIYEMYSENVLGVIYNILKDETLSEEVLQDVFVKVWNKADTYSEKKGRFFTWILNIARNAAIDKTRSTAFKNSKQNQNADFFVDILEEKSNFSSKVDAIGIKKYIEILEPICKKVIDLLFFKGFTQKEASEELDIPIGTIKTRNRICINKLREALAV